MLQRLGEVGEPLRIGDLASQLQMTAVAVARAVDGLAEEDGWSAWPAPRPKGRVRRRHPRASGSGRSSRAPSPCLRKHLWSRLDDRQRCALARTGASSSPTSKRARRPSAKSPSASSSPSTTRVVCAWIADARLPHAKTISAPDKRRARRSHFLFTAIGGKILAVKIFERRPLVYEPPFDPTDKITATALDIAEMVGRLAPDSALSSSPVLHRELRIKTIHSSLAIEQNTLTMEQVTDIIDGRRVFGPPDDIREVRNAKRAYDLLGNWDPRNMDDLLEAHGVMMEGLRKDAGTFRTKNAGVYDGSIDPCRNPASYVPEVMADLFEWLGSTKLHPLLASCVFHYEFEFIHPFSDETAASEGSAHAAAG
ncbi:MAG: Fic family protein [Eggerthellaceae bacterium]